uniref:G protein-coupled receptor n=1 Tax=Panagrolaimus davidi TaxID=227884 RepID=A0A914NX33_9BILA
MTADIRDLPFLGIVSYATILISVAYGIVIWTSFKVWKHLKNMEHHMTVKTKDVNQQMTLALIIQAILPLFVLLLPIAVTILMLFARASIGGIGISVSLLISWIPIVNSLITIIVVKSYRNSVRKILCHFSKRNIVNVTSNIVKDTSVVRSQIVKH